MRYEIPKQSKLASRLVQVGQHVRAKSKNKTSRIRCQYNTDPKVVDFTVLVSTCNNVGLSYCGVFNKVFTYIELKYGQLTVEQAKTDCPNSKLEQLDDRKAVALLNKFLNTHFSS